MKELNAFRKFLSEGKGSTVKLSQSDMDKLHKDKEIEVDDHIIQFGEGEENVSENTTMPDFDIMGQTFNFSDICPSAHKLVQNQAIVHQGHRFMGPTVFNFAFKHKQFFNWEKEALGPQGITVDEFNDEVKRLYVEILNTAEKLGVRKQAKEYMDMHMAKIKDHGFKASEPGGSSDRNFEEGYEPTDKELDFADEIEYEQDWRDEQDDLFGTPDYKRGRGYYMDEEGDENEFLEEALKRVRKVLGDSIEGYMDLHKNDVALESFLGKEELNEGPLDEKQKYADDQLKFKEGDTVYFKNVKDGKNLPMTITGPGKFMKSNRLGAGGKEIVFPVKGGPGGKGMYAADDLVKEDQEKIEEGPVKTFTSGLSNYQSYPHVYVFKVRTMSTSKQGDKFVYNHTYEVKDGLDWNGVLAQVDQLIASPETIAVGVDIYYTTGQSEGQLGGQAEVVRWNHDAVYKAPKSDYILNARKNQFEDEEAERIIAIRKFMNSSLMGRPPQNVDNQAEELYPAIKRMKDEVKSILATK